MIIFRDNRFIITRYIPHQQQQCQIWIQNHKQNLLVFDCISPFQKVEFLTELKPNFSPYTPLAFLTHGIHSLLDFQAPAVGDFPSYQRIPRRAVSPSFLVVPPSVKGRFRHVALGGTAKEKWRSAELRKQW